jgi:hypothetical protein
MWKGIIFGVLNCLLILHGSNLFAETTHLKSLHSKYPHALLGNDFGILKEDDLAINSCTADPIPFSKTSTSYPYWQCFEVSKTKIECDGHKYAESEKMRFSLLVLSAVTKEGNHEYFHDRMMPLGACREFIRDWKRLVKGQEYVCISGSFVNKNADETDRPVLLWDFDRFKTRRGCSSYFEGGCSLKYQRRVHGCKPKEFATLQAPQ